MKMRRCLTDPHYWKSPALRRSREKEPSKRSQDSWSKKMTPVTVRIRWIRPSGIMTQNPQDAAATVMFYHVLTLRVGQHPLLFGGNEISRKAKTCQMRRMFWTSFPRAETLTHIKARSHIAPESSEKEPFR